MNFANVNDCVYWEYTQSLTFNKLTGLTAQTVNCFEKQLLTPAMRNSWAWD